MLLRDPSRNRQAQSGPFARTCRIGLVEALEDPLHIRLGDPRAIVENDQACQTLTVFES